MSDSAAAPFTPLVRGATNTESINIESFMGQFDDETYYVPN
jgi:hypothetical protein